MKVIAIVQARMGSMRLPGKVLKQVNGKPLLEYQIERMKRAENVDQIVVSTTTKPLDDPIIDLCERLNIHTFRGSEEDVLGRFYETGRFFGADVIIRLTADCPLIDPVLIDTVVEFFLQNQPNYLYVTNAQTYPQGMKVETFTYEVLKDAYMNANTAYDLEYMTPFILKRVESSAIAEVVHVADESPYHLKVETQEDFQLVEEVLQTLYPKNPLFPMSDVIRFLKQNPKWEKRVLGLSNKKSDSRYDNV